MHYAIALGSNRPHGQYGSPRQIIKAALRALDLPLIAVSRTIESNPIGPSQRRYANAAVVIETDLDPQDLLDHLQSIELCFGRRRGQRWGARVLDLDIIFWSEGSWSSPGLTIPHVAFRTRDFVVSPLVEIAPRWRDPVTRQTVRHMKAQLDRRHPHN